MKATVEEINSVQRRIKVVCSAEVVSKAFDNAYRNLTSKVQMRGFRKGKVPLAMVKRFYGETVNSDVANDLVRDNLFKAIAEKNLLPIAPPVLEMNQWPRENEDFEFSAVVDQMPVLDIGGYKNLKLRYAEPVFEKDPVTDEIEHLRRKAAKTEDTTLDTKAASGHLITFSQVARDSEGTLVPEMDAKDVTVELAAGNLLPDLENAILGRGVGDIVAIKLPVPENYQIKHLAGKSYDFELTITKIQNLLLPEVDDEFAKDLGLDNIQQLNAEITKNLQSVMESDRRNKLEEQVFQALTAENVFEVPPALVDRVIDNLIEEENNKATTKQKKKKDSQNDESLRERYRDQAKMQARNSLILMDVIKKEQLEVTDGDVEAHFRRMFAGESISPRDQEFMKNIEASLPTMVKNFSPRQRESLLFSKAIDWIIAHATIVAP